MHAESSAAPSLMLDTSEEPEQEGNVEGEPPLNMDRKGRVKSELYCTSDKVLWNCSSGTDEEMEEKFLALLSP